MDLGGLGGAGMALNPVGMIATGYGLAGSYMNWDAQNRANAQNEKIAERQMDFQRDMSNTAHQREMKDLIAAGLNPVLSAKGSGASTPGGAAATMVAPRVELPDLIGTAVSLKQLEQTDKKIAIDERNSNANIAKGLTDQELTKMKTLTGQKGLPRAEMEGRAGRLLQRILDRVDKIGDSKSKPREKLDYSNIKTTPEHRKTLHNIQNYFNQKRSMP